MGLNVDAVPRWCKEPTESQAPPPPPRAHTSDWALADCRGSSCGRSPYPAAASDVSGENGTGATRPRAPSARLGCAEPHTPPRWRAAGPSAASQLGHCPSRRPHGHHGHHGHRPCRHSPGPRNGRRRRRHPLVRHPWAPSAAAAQSRRLRHQPSPPWRSTSTTPLASPGRCPGCRTWRRPTCSRPSCGRPARRQFRQAGRTGGQWPTTPSPARRSRSTPDRADRPCGCRASHRG